MKKIWKIMMAGALALSLLAGCGAPAAQPERQPIQLPQEQAPAADSGSNQAPAQTPPENSAPEVPVTPPQTDSQQPAPQQPAQPEEPVVEQPVENPAPVPPEEAEVTDTRLLCTLEIRCDRLVGNPDLDPDKVELIPQDGVLFTAAEVEFFEGESVFNVMQRTLKQNKEHLEFAQSPLYNSAYIEGICNLYAYDCGDLSGWMYRVNDWYPNYGCSQYVVQNGDVIVWDYTCDLGADLGVTDATGNNQ